jgi:hypothetical protein
MNIEEFYSRMRRELTGYSNPTREDTSAFLIWFLINYFRMEPQDAVDSVCDHTNDKGIDGIVVDDEEETIYLFQSKFSPSDTQSQGDGDLRNFIGARAWFQSEETVQNLIDSTAHHELKSLVQRTNIKEKTDFSLTSVFVTNKHFNIHANEYIPTIAELEAYDAGKLFKEYTYFADEVITTPPIALFLTNQTKIDYDLGDGTTAKVYAIRAKELVKLKGIEDRTLFYKNVRYGVGNTRVNKSIRKTILSASEHRMFFLYHNGITLVCGSFNEDPSRNCINISNYAIINGCQSMLTFYENRDRLTDDLLILTKIINLDVSSPIVQQITFYANNQNSIGLADLRSNDSAQKAIQREFSELFGNSVVYLRKRGETVREGTKAIDKDLAAQLIEAVYYGNPHNTHLKQKLFGEEYSKIFSRRIRADKIYLAYLLYRTVNRNSHLLDKPQIRTYGLSLFFFAYTLSAIMQRDDVGNSILDNPREYVTSQAQTLSNTLERLWSLITPDLNADIDDYISQAGGFFDYKNLFKNSAFVDTMSRRAVADYERLVRRNASDSFGNIYNSFASGQT